MIESSLSFAEFPIPTDEEWQQAASESLHGKPLDSLIVHTYEGIDLPPMLRRGDTADITHQHTLPGQPPYVRGTHAAGYLKQPWLIAQELTYPTPQTFNKALLHDLAGGQTAVSIRLDQPTRHGRNLDQSQPGEVGRDGLSLATTDDITTTLHGVELTNTPIIINPGISSLPLFALLIAAIRKQGLPTADLSGALAFDPLGILAAEGTLPLSLEQAYDEMAQVTAWAATNTPNLATIAIHSTPYHEGGGSAVEELAFSIAAGVAYLRAMQAQGVAINTAAHHLRFEFAIGSHFFIEVAKLRAARLLWSQIVAAFGGDEEAQKMQLHGRTAQRNKSNLAPYINILRGTAEALTAALGSVDSLHITPFDEPIHPATEFSHRIARNTQIILQEESHLTGLIDPAAGSYTVEYLTDQLGRKAWALFQEVERWGGIVAALQEGFSQRIISETAAKRQAAFDEGQDVFVGINQYTDPNPELIAADAPDYDTIYQERSTQLVTYRQAISDTAALSAALKQLAYAKSDTVVEVAITAAAAGATLTDLTQALHHGDQPTSSILPFKAYRLSVELKLVR